LINSFAVKQNRDQKMMQREKTDPIECGAIGDLLRRGEGTPYKPATGIYIQLQQLDRVRLSKVKIEGMLKYQIIAHLDRIFPGLLILGKGAREHYTPLFQVNFWQCQTLQHLIRVCPNLHQLVQMTPEQLLQAKRSPWGANHRQSSNGALAGSRTCGHPLRTLAEQSALAGNRPGPHRRTRAEPDRVGRSNPFPGLGPTLRPQCRADRQSGRNDSGNRQSKGKGSSIVKAGDVYLRRALMNAVTTLLLL
jgi:hypothetical protein